jgi:hypothetical protein
MLYRKRPEISTGGVTSRLGRSAEMTERVCTNEADHNPIRRSECNRQEVVTLAATLAALDCHGGRLYS